MCRFYSLSEGAFSGRRGRRPLPLRWVLTARTGEHSSPLRKPKQKASAAAEAFSSFLNRKGQHLRAGIIALHLDRNFVRTYFSTICRICNRIILTLFEELACGILQSNRRRPKRSGALVLRVGQFGYLHLGYVLRVHLEGQRLGAAVVAFHLDGDLVRACIPAVGRIVYGIIRTLFQQFACGILQGDGGSPNGSRIAVLRVGKFGYLHLGYVLRIHLEGQRLGAAVVAFHLDGDLVRACIPAVGRIVYGIIRTLFQQFACGILQGDGGSPNGSRIAVLRVGKFGYLHLGYVLRIHLEGQCLGAAVVAFHLDGDLMCAYVSAIRRIGNSVIHIFFQQLTLRVLQRNGRGPDRTSIAILSIG